MGRKITFTATLAIQVDEQVWADEYGMSTAEVREDVSAHLAEYVKSLLGGTGLAYLFESVSVRKPSVRVEC